MVIAIFKTKENTLLTTSELVDRLAQHTTVGSAPRTELEWLATHGDFRRFASGEIVSTKGMEVRSLNIVLSGRVALFIERGAGPNRIIEWRGGDVAGMLPYSRLAVAPGNSSAQEPTELLAVDRECIPEMIRECHHVTSILVHTMLDRTRLFTSTELHNEKMISLGKLSAGLAHELNNPAAAIERCAALLQIRLAESEEAAQGLAAVVLKEEQMAAIDKLRTVCLGNGASFLGTPSLTPLEQSDREEAMADWLLAHRLEVRYAEMLADTDASFEQLDELASILHGEALRTAILYCASGSAVRKLTAMIQDASSRVSGLINAVKGFTQMDQANAAATLELAPHLKNAIAVLGAKAAAKLATVTLQIEENLPCVRGYAGELNQVWGNLLDNALDAVPSGGIVEVRASQEKDRVIVRILDNGLGVPVEIRDRIFDPFFTTKPQGQGIGLGLDIARRLALHNDGTVQLEVHPGQTEFLVSLPVAERLSS